MQNWQLGRGTLKAFRDSTGNLHIAAQGDKPTPCHQVQIRQRPERIFPPQFELVWHSEGICIQMITPYQIVSGPFPYPKDQKTVRVFTAEGEQDVQIENMKKPLPSCEPSERNEKIAESDTAVGYSEKFHFDEAFANAIANLPPRDPSHPDELIHIRVTDTGAEIGGIAGFHRMFVRVSRRAT